MKATWLGHMLLGVMGLILVGYFIYQLANLQWARIEIAELLVNLLTCLMMLVATVANFCLAIAFKEGRVDAVVGSRSDATILREGGEILRGVRLHAVKELYEDRLGVTPFVFFITRRRPWVCRKDNFLKMAPPTA